MKTQISVWGAAAALLCMAHGAVAQQQPVQPLPAQAPVQVQVIVPSDEYANPRMEQYAPRYGDDALSIEAQMVLREYRAQKRRAYYEVLIGHQAKMDNMYREQVVAMKEAKARAVANNGKKESPITSLADSKPQASDATPTPTGKSTGRQFPGDSK